MNEPEQKNQNQDTIINIDKLGKDKNYTIKLSLESSPGVSEQVRGLVITIITATIIFIATLYSVNTLSSSKTLEGEKKFAQSILSFVVGNATGFLIGKSTTNKS